MYKLLAFLLWWIQRVFEQMESVAANLSKEVIKHIDHYRLPIWKNPFIATEPKPPTAFA